MLHSRERFSLVKKIQKEEELAEVTWAIITVDVEAAKFRESSGSSRRFKVCRIY